MYKIQQGNEEINSNSGISLIGALLRNVKSFMKFDKMTFGKVKKWHTSHVGAGGVCPEWGLVGCMGLVGSVGNGAKLRLIFSLFYVFSNIFY